MSSLRLDPQDWDELSRLLDYGLNLSPSERSHWLLSLDKQQLRFCQTLQEMFGRTPAIEARGFLDELPQITPHVEQCEVTDACVGGYRLIRLLGTGGMGSVWLAKRLDGLVKRPVALKLPLVQYGRADLAARLARERDILGALSHPNIARLYDAGLADDGRPYLALEYIEGQAIDQYCHERGLALGERLQLFLQIARAVAHAHANLIIHRDLKPANILVTNDGEVKLLDFGVAKLLEGPHAPVTHLTEVAGRALTLDYASPEQIAGGPLGTATDIYSLGVLLYTLIACARPYSLERNTRGALEDAILQAQPAKPSEVSCYSWRTTLRGDLDTITLHAMRKSPSERYATVDAFIDDLERFADRRPVLAQPDSAWYRVRKFTARHALACVLATTVVLTTAVGAVLATWQMMEANEQRDVAFLQQRRAEAFSQFMGVLLHDAGAQARVLTPTALLDRGVAMLEAQRALDPAVQAFMWYELSRSYRIFYQTERERALLDRASEGARAVGDMNLLAATQCAAAWSVLERSPQMAMARLRTARAALGSAIEPDDYAAIECLRAESRLLHVQGDVQKAIALIEHGLTQLKQNPRGRWYYAALRDQLAGLHRAIGNNVAALRISEDQLAVLRELGRRNSNAELMLLSSYGRDQCLVGEYLACAKTHEHVLQALSRMEEGGLVLAGAHSRAAIAHLELGDPARALALADHDLNASKPSGNLAVLGQAQWIAASSLVALGRYAEAEQRLAAAEQIWQSSPGAFSAQLVDAQHLHATIALKRVDTVGAQERLSRLLRQVGYPARESVPRLHQHLLLAARIEQRSGHLKRAADFARQALAVAKHRSTGRHTSGDVGAAALMHAGLLEQLGQTSDARPLAHLAFTALSNAMGSAHPTTHEARTLCDRLRCVRESAIE